MSKKDFFSESILEILIFVPYHLNLFVIITKKTLALNFNKIFTTNSL